MKKISLLLLIAIFGLTACKQNEKSRQPERVVSTSTEPELEKNDITEDISEVKISPIEHATMVLEYKNEVIYIDPVGGKDAFKTCKNPTLLVITDIHGDHLNIETIEAVMNDSIKIIAPKAVTDKLPESLKNKVTVMNNGDKATINTINFEAIPMYNLRPEALKFHSKGRGNGYVITFGNERFYISGDTEDIPEMRQLKNIDKAFVCMNLPYTMTVDSAASAVLDFKPKQVYPYHFRGTEGFSDVGKFKMLVNSNSDEIEVVQLDWYKE